MDNEKEVKTMDEAYEPDKANVKKWAAFVESDAANFFTGYKLEKMTLEDGNGNKAKFSKTKDGGIKVDYTSSVLL
ncbi:hypothetical protein SDC9_104304 [bioreactor metagenome]|jgi:hypothetical protein|uniref:Uncharacterized protein n=1 Tax=bioreactor metagenome TaxID=1076179 RepID=A0A645AW56_9ZZZZ